MHFIKSIVVLIESKLNLDFCLFDKDESPLALRPMRRRTWRRIKPAIATSSESDSSGDKLLESIKEPNTPLGSEPSSTESYKEGDPASPTSSVLSDEHSLSSIHSNSSAAELSPLSRSSADTDDLMLAHALEVSLIIL
jgi:hypothetical protein